MKCVSVFLCFVFNCIDDYLFLVELNLKLIYLLN